MSSIMRAIGFDQAVKDRSLSEEKNLSLYQGWPLPCNAPGRSARAAVTAVTELEN
jgi:hypothetical protein